MVQPVPQLIRYTNSPQGMYVQRIVIVIGNAPEIFGVPWDYLRHRKLNSWLYKVH